METLKQETHTRVLKMASQSVIIVEQLSAPSYLGRRIVVVVRGSILSLSLSFKFSFTD